MTRLVAATGGVVLSLTAGAGIASALPDITPLVNSTCTYDQIVAAMNANAPEFAPKILNNGLATFWLRQLIAAGPDQRRQMYEDAAARYPGLEANTPTVIMVANTCNNF